MKLEDRNRFKFSKMEFGGYAFNVATRDDGTRWIARSTLEAMTGVDFSRTELCGGGATIRIITKKSDGCGVIKGGRVTAYISCETAGKVLQKYKPELDIHQLFFNEARKTVVSVKETDTSASAEMKKPEAAPFKAGAGITALVIAPTSLTITAQAECKINGIPVTVISLFSPSERSVSYADVSDLASAIGMPGDDLGLLLGKLVGTSLASEAGLEFARIMLPGKGDRTFIKASSVYALLAGLRTYWARLMPDKRMPNVSEDLLAAAQTGLLGAADEALRAFTTVPKAELNMAGVREGSPMPERTTSNVVQIPVSGSGSTESESDKSAESSDEKRAEDMADLLESTESVRSEYTVVRKKSKARNSTVTEMAALVTKGVTYTVCFEGDYVPVIVSDDGLKWVPLCSLCANLGIDAWTQIVKAHGDEKLITRDIPGRDSRGRSTTLVCLALDSVPAWLFSINTQKVADFVRPKLLAYQKDLVRAINEYVTTGVAINPAVMPSTTGIDQVVDKLVGIMKEYMEGMQKLVERVISDRDQALEKAADLAQKHIATRDTALKTLETRLKEEREAAIAAELAAEEAKSREAEIRQSIESLKSKAEKFDTYVNLDWHKTSTVLAPELGFTSAQELNKALRDMGYVKTTELYPHVWIPTAKLMRLCPKGASLGVVGRKLKAPGTAFGNNPYVHTWYWSHTGEIILKELFANRINKAGEDLKVEVPENELNIGVSKLVSFESCL